MDQGTNRHRQSPHRRRKRVDVGSCRSGCKAGTRSIRNRSGRYRSHRLRDRDARSHLSRDGGENTRHARCHEGRGLRRPGRLLGLRLCLDDRRQFPENRAVEASAGHWRRNVLSHSRLVRPLDVRALRRRSGRCRARSSAAARNARRSGHPRNSSQIRWAVTKICSTSMAGPARRRRSGTCA